MKKCTQCQKLKPLADFNKNKRTKDGLRYQCRDCQALEYQAGRDRRIAKAAEWVARNREKSRNYKAKWRESNPDYGKEHYESNKDKYLAHATRWQIENKEKVAARNSKWKGLNPEKVSSSRQNRRAMAKGADGHHGKDDILDIFSKQGGRCVYCRSSLVRSGPGKMHIDHIIPLSKGGSNWPNNLQLLCPTCNLRKGATDPFEFARRRGMLV